MFNLDQASANWRRRLMAAGIKSSEILDELECHLRQDVQWQKQAGLAEEQAFKTAVERIGDAGALKTEFDKNNSIKRMKALIISAGMLAILVGLAFVLPAVAQYRHSGAMTNQEVGLFVLGGALTLGGGGAAVFGFKGAKRRG
jgi:hypothetical protein